MKALVVSASAVLLLGGLTLHGQGALLVPAEVALPVPAVAPRPTPVLPPAATGPWPVQLARPLFERERRMPAPPPEAAALREPEPDPPTSASGIVVGPAGPVALLRLGDGRLVRASEGSEIAGWRVARIGATSVELRRGERMVTLSARLAAPGDSPAQ